MFVLPPLMPVLLGVVVSVLVTLVVVSLMIVPVAVQGNDVDRGTVGRWRDDRGRAIALGRAVAIAFQLHGVGGHAAAEAEGAQCGKGEDGAGDGHRGLRAGCDDRITHRSGNAMTWLVYPAVAICKPPTLAAGCRCQWLISERP